MNLNQAAVQGYPSHPEYIPDRPELQPWVRTRPTPAVARRGQALFLTTALLHGGWHNADTAERKALTISYTAAGVPCGCPGPEALESKRRFFEHARRRLPPDRAHVVPSVAEMVHFDGGDYSTHWPETFLPGARL